MTSKVATVIFWALLIALPLVFGTGIWWLFFFAGVLGMVGMILALVFSFVLGRQSIFKDWEAWQFITGLGVSVVLAIALWLVFCLGFTKGVKGGAIYCGSAVGYMVFYLVTRAPFLNYRIFRYRFQKCRVQRRKVLIFGRLAEA